MHALIKNGVVKQYPYGIGQLKLDNPNTSFPDAMSDEALQSFGVQRVGVSAPPEFDSKTQVFSEDAPVFDAEAQRWVQGWTVRNKAADELSAEAAEKSVQVRVQRNRKLTETDWTQVADAPVDKAAWATYRQELRDITTQAGFPWDIAWPVEP